MLWEIIIVIVIAIFGLFLRSDVDLPILFLQYNVENSFENKVIWITGGSSGIGASLAETMVQAGAKVIISTRRLSKLEEVANKCSQFGIKPFVLPLDVTDYIAQEEAYKTIITEFSRIDILVLNPGIASRLSAVDTPLSDTQHLFNLNFISVAALTKLVLPDMIERKEGQLVIVSSLSGIIPTPMSSSYSASKFALNGYYTALRSEVSMNGITVTIVCPGPVVSEIFDKVHKDKNLPSATEGGRMSTARCTYLIAKAIYYRWTHIWISEQPYLFMAYRAQYMPYVNNLLFSEIIGPRKLKKFNKLSSQNMV